MPENNRNKLYEYYHSLSFIKRVIFRANVLAKVYKPDKNRIFYHWIYGTTIPQTLEKIIINEVASKQLFEIPGSPEVETTAYELVGEQR
ncbi:MAG: hypothetical protein KAT68_17835 [Bacteroidales bacterium]|nr:hypothetical protein [Bacteroidales bacterium]